jgi:hypothetical protein
MEISRVLAQLNALNFRHPAREWKLFVEVFNPGTIRGKPCVEVARLNRGIDWDQGKVIIKTDTPLTMLTPEDVAAIHKSAKAGHSWHALQSYQKQRDQIKALEAEVAKLKAA